MKKKATNSRLPVPPELEALIEKRDDETDRRTGERRKRTRSTSTSAAAAQPERRKGERRKTRRRKSG